MDNVVFAPWTQEQVDALNRWQGCGWVHPFTCGKNDHGYLNSQRTLVATKNGWVCPNCDYTQDWAHDFMFEEPPSFPFPTQEKGS